jgi:hypothetical protein
MRRIVTVVIVVWLVIGALAAGQRGYYSSNHKTNCSQAGDTVLTIISGPLNYVGVDPKVSCTTPQPSNN